MLNHLTPAAATRVTGAVGPAGPRPPGILVVDDNDDIRHLLALGLARHGFVVWLAADGGAAVANYQSHRGSIDVTLLDVLMPGRDGPGTLADLREVDPCVAACFMTGEAGGYTDETLKELGPLAVFRKPFRVLQLAEQLAGLATRRHAHGADGGRHDPIDPAVVGDQSDGDGARAKVGRTG